MTHLWPSEDQFDVGSPAYDSAYLLGYMRSRFVTSDPGGGSGYGLSSGTWHTTNYLYTGWGAGLAANTNPASVTNLLGGWTWRSYTDDDVEVAARWQTVADSALIATVERKTHFGVGARIKGSTLTSGGTINAYHDNCDGYFGVFLYEPTLGLLGRYQLWRVVGGTVTLLAQSAQLVWAELSITESRSMRLKVSGTGATVTLELWVSTPSRLLEELKLSYSDTSGSRITTAGRVGFFSTCEASLSGIKAAICLNWFEAGPVGGTMVLHDEWQRTNLLACRPLSTALFPGRVLISSWYGDLFSVSALASILEVDSGGRLFVGANRDVSLLSQRPASDSIRQDRRCTFKFASGSLVPNPSVRAVGIVLRAAVVTAGQAVDSGYLLEVDWDDHAATASASLYRIVGQVETLISEKSSLGGISLGVDFDLRLVVDNSAIPDPLTGPVILKGYIGSSQIGFTGVGASGVSVNGVGTVTDSSTFRVSSGDGEGVHIQNPASSARRVEMDAWVVGGTVTPVEVDLLDLASIPIALETDGATGTLTLPYSIGVQEDVVTQNVVHEFDSDHKWRGTVGGLAFRRVWSLDLKGCTPDELAAFEAFFDDHKSCEVPFTWTPPGADEPAITARFWLDKPPSTQKAPEVRAVSYKILECVS